MSMNQNPDEGVSYPDPKEDTNCYFCKIEFDGDEHKHENYMGTKKTICTGCMERISSDEDAQEIMEIQEARINNLIAQVAYQKKLLKAATKSRDGKIENFRSLWIYICNPHRTVENKVLYAKQLSRINIPNFVPWANSREVGMGKEAGLNKTDHSI